MKNVLKRILKKVSGTNSNVTNYISLNGYIDNLQEIRYIDYLKDWELEELNNILDWKAFVADSSGRRFGNIARFDKRTTPQAIPDSRHLILNDRLPLKNKNVLEIGCFEGIHTISLCRLAKKVVAIDSRIQNVVKTILRCNLFNEKPTVFKCDVETWDAPKDWLKTDVCHHIGVLYHLKDPVTHLQNLCPLISDAIFLDTHIALPSDSLDQYQVNGVSYSYKRYGEFGKNEVFSGMYDHAKWMLLDDIKKVLVQNGFEKIEIIQERKERNGPRVLVLAQK